MAHLAAASGGGATDSQLAGVADLGAGGGLVALVLLLLWEPAITVAELKSQQNIIAVLMDDSRSMSIADAGTDGTTARETAAMQALGKVLPGLRRSSRRGFTGWTAG